MKLSDWIRGFFAFTVPPMLFYFTGTGEFFYRAIAVFALLAFASIGFYIVMESIDLEEAKRQADIGGDVDEHER